MLLDLCSSRYDPMEFDDFRKQVKDALEHLYDTAHLETHPLLIHVAETIAATRTTRAQKLRALLKDAIEQLRPQDSLPSGAPEWRSYLALRYRYVQGMSPGEIESELGISLRQLQRELHKGLDALATLLWEQCRSIDCRTGRGAGTGNRIEPVDTRAAKLRFARAD